MMLSGQDVKELMFISGLIGVMIGINIAKAFSRRKHSL